MHAAKKLIFMRLAGGFALEHALLLQLVKLSLSYLGDLLAIQQREREREGERERERKQSVW